MPRSPDDIRDELMVLRCLRRDLSAWDELICILIRDILRAVMSDTIGERHASACRYKNEVPEGSRRSARPTHFCPREI